VDLQRAIAARSGEFLFFAVTPPRLTTSPQESAEIARITLERLRGLAIDGAAGYSSSSKAAAVSCARPRASRAFYATARDVVARPEPELHPLGSDPPNG